MLHQPGMPFRLWVEDSNSAFTSENGIRCEQIELLLELYDQGHIERLILSSANTGHSHPLNLMMAMAGLSCEHADIKPPDYVFETSDNMLYKDGWLKSCYDTIIDCEQYGRKITIVSPFHCKNSNGRVAPSMDTENLFTIGDRSYEIKKWVSGNTWFVTGDTWLNFFGFYPTKQPSAGRDWSKLRMLRDAGHKCAVTPEEMAYKHPDATAGGQYDVRGHWS